MTSTTAPRTVLLRSSWTTVNIGVEHSRELIAALRDESPDAEIIIL